MQTAYKGQRAMERTMLENSLRDRLKNKEVGKKTGVIGILKEILTNK